MVSFSSLLLCFVGFCSGWKKERERGDPPGDSQRSRAHSWPKGSLLSLGPLAFPKVSMWRVPLPWTILACNSSISGLRLGTYFLLDFLIQQSSSSPPPKFQGTEKSSGTAWEFYFATCLCIQFDYIGFALQLHKRGSPFDFCLKLARAWSKG